MTTLEKQGASGTATGHTEGSGAAVLIGLSLLVAAVMAVTGCGGDARMELAATDALTAVADQMELTIGEYHREMAWYDDSRESAVISALALSPSVCISVPSTAVSLEVAAGPAAMSAAR